jgi:hypothetical protein
MSSGALRRKVATLIVAVLITFSAAAPAQAAFGRNGRHTDDAASWSTGERGFIALLLRLIAKAGGAMDPNGNH